LSSNPVDWNYAVHAGIVIYSFLLLQDRVLYYAIILKIPVANSQAAEEEIIFTSWNFID